MVEAGGKYEEKKEGGISHFLEHMIFKGTEKRKKSMDISLDFDKLGAQSNAMTSYEWTGYFAKAHNRHLGKLMEILSDMYINPTFPEVEIEKEKGVIIQEIKRDEDLPSRNVLRIFMELLYGDQPAGRSILGEEKMIKGVTIENFLNYRKRNYVSSATTVIVAGDIDYKKIESQVGHYFGSLPNTKKDNKPKVADGQKFPKILVKRKKTAQSHFILGFRAYPNKHPNIPTLKVLDAILSSGMSSRLWQKMREELGICYYVKSFLADYSDHGIFAVASGVDSKRVKVAINAVLDEFKKLKIKDVSSEELEKAKESLISNFFMENEKSDELAFYFGEQEIMKQKIKTPEEVEKEIRKVTPTQIRKVAKEIFNNKSLNLAIIGDIKDEKTLLKLLKV